MAVRRSQQSRFAPSTSETSHTTGTVANSIEIAARHRIKPYRQSELDYLCGLYATINAMRLLRQDFEPMAKAEAKALLAAGSRYLASKQNGLHIALTWGLDLRRRYALARHLAKIASTDKYAFRVERSGLPAHAPIETVFAWIDDSLASGKPVLIFFENMPDHYTVVVGSTRSTLLLFDSAGMRFVRRTNCGVGRGSRQIAPNGLLRISLEHLT